MVATCLVSSCYSKAGFCSLASNEKCFNYRGEVGELGVQGRG